MASANIEPLTKGLIIVSKFDQIFWSTNQFKQFSKIWKEKQNLNNERPHRRRGIRKKRLSRQEHTLFVQTIVGRIHCAPFHIDERAALEHWQQAISFERFE